MPDEDSTAAPAGILESTVAYEKWLKAHLGGELVQDDLKEKHQKMRKDPFTFLRATFWRWAETVYDQCPEFRGAPEVLAVGDIHLENFGVWRDADGRLVWGVNDFDEAAKMPYALDLVRLAVSAMLAPGGRKHAASFCSAILNGYREGLRKPAAFVLDRDHRWLRDRFEVGDDERAAFWDKLAAHRAGAGAERPAARYRKAIKAALPEGSIALDYWPSAAGTGSLGRPRWRAAGDWRGAPIVREVKAVVPSAFSRVSGRGGKRSRDIEAASGRFRSPDPWYTRSKHLIVRRLSPNSRKLEIKDRRVVLLDRKMLQHMGAELANVHLGTVDEKELAAVRRAIVRDLARRGDRWLHTAAEKMAWLTQRDHRAWRRAYRSESSLRGKKRQ